MAAISSYGRDLMLNWVLRNTGAAPAAWGVSLALGAPSSISASEVGAGSNLDRKTVVFNAATSGTCSNSAALTFGTATGAVTISGLAVWDTASSVNGSMLWYGTLAAARTLASGDSLVIATGALVITLA